MYPTAQITLSPPPSHPWVPLRSREYRFTHMNRSTVDIPFLSEALSGESHFSHMCSSTLHDPIFPHVHFQQEYALACLATCAVPTNMYDPILPHVQFQQEYELASLGSFTHPYFFYVPCM